MPAPNTDSLSRAGATSPSPGMMRLYDAKTGAPVDVPYSQATDGIVAGKWGLPKGTIVTIVRRSGSTGTTPIEQALTEFSKGAKIIPPEY